MMKKLLSGLLCLCMIVTLLPVTTIWAETTSTDYCITEFDAEAIQTLLDGIAEVTQVGEKKINIKLISDVAGRLVFDVNVSYYDFVLDLNGKTIDPGTLYEAIWITDKGYYTVTLTGSGVLKQGVNYTIDCSGGSSIAFAVAEGYNYYSLTYNTSSYLFNEKNTTTNRRSYWNLRTDNGLTITQGTLPAYTVHYDANGGSGTMEDQVLFSEQNYTLRPNTFVNGNYSFIGWSTTPDGAVEYINKQSITNLGNADETVTLYAVWDTEYLDYRITSFNVDDVQAVLGDIAEVTLVERDNHAYEHIYNNYIGIRLNSDVNGRLCFEDNGNSHFLLDLNGKTIDPGNAGGAIYVGNGSASDITITGSGVIKQGSEYTIYKEFSPTLHFIVDEDYHYYSLTYNTSSHLYSEKNTRRNYEPSLWNFVTTDGLTMTQGLFPHYTVVFDANGGEGEAVEQKIPTDTATALKANTYTKDGYYVLGWSTTPDGEVEYADKATVTGLAATDGTITLYAIWDQNHTDYRITSFNLDDLEELFAGVAEVTAVDSRTRKIKLTSDIRGRLFFNDTTNNTFIIDLNGKTITPGNLSGSIHIEGNINNSNVVLTGSGTLKQGSSNTIYCGFFPRIYFRVAEDYHYYSLNYDSSHLFDEKNTSEKYKNNWELDTVGGLTMTQGHLPGYLVAFDANGGSGTMEEQYIATELSTALRKNTFTKQYYTFAGWSTTPGGEVEYTDKQIVTALASTDDIIDLYAVWAPNHNEYTIDSNNVEAISTTLNGLAEVSEVTVDDSTAIKIKLTSNIDGRLDFDNHTANYILDLNGKTIDPGNLDEAICLNSGFGGNLTITGAGTLKQGAENTVFCDAAATITFKVTDNRNYFTAKDGMADVFDPRNTDPVTRSNWAIDTAEALVIRQHQSNYRYRITFDANGGEVSTSSMNTNNQGYITSELPTPTMEGPYEFAGWYTEKNGGTLITSSTLHDWDKTVYARWTYTGQGTVYSVKFNANGGTGYMPLQPIAVGTPTALAENTFTKEYYTLKGWSTTSSGEVEFTDTEAVTDIAAAGEVITLYAIWKNACKVYSITENNISSISRILDGVAEVSAVTLDGQAAVKIKLTSDILGQLYFNDFTGNIILDLNGKTITAGTRDQSICLDHNFRGNITITGDGVINKGVYHAIYNSRATVNFAVAEGNDCYTLKKGSADFFDIANTETKSTTGHVYDTITIAQKTFTSCTITFDANGGTVSPESAVTGFDGKLETLPTPSRTGSYTFNGWFTAASGGTEVTTETAFVEDITIYAQWTDTSDPGSGPGTDPTPGPGTDPNPPVISGGTSNSGSKYTINFNTNGGNTITSKRVEKNSKVSKPADPKKEGYIFGGWYTDSSLNNEYNFNSPVTKAFTLYAKWIATDAADTDDETESDDVADAEDEADTDATQTSLSSAFSDLKADAWYHEAVEYALSEGILKGMTETTFEPDGKLTRAMLVTVLYRLEGEPATNRSIPFGDIDMGSYYANAVVWAQQTGLVNGVTETEFAPNNNISREQIATIIYRYAQTKGMDAVTLEENLHFADSNEISEYAVSAMNWAVGTGLINGKTESTINPKDNATRAEIATILYRFIETNK